MEIHLDQILLQALNFGIVLFVLVKFLYKPVIKILDQRSEKIDAGLAAAEKNLEEQAKVEELKKQQLSQAEKQAGKIIEEAKQEAEKMGKTIVDKARSEAEAAVKKEEEAFKNRMSVEETKLKNRLTDLILTTSKAVLKDSLSQEHQQEIIKSQIQGLKKVKIN